MKQKTEDLTNEFYKITQKVYGQAGGNPSEGGANPGENKKDDGDDTIDGDYEVVD